MTSTRLAIPIEVTIRRDLSDGFRTLGDYNLEHALERAGSINIDLKTDRSGREHFEVDLVDRLFRESRKALRRGKPAMISLNTHALFEIVQKCRTRWEDAIETVKHRVPASDAKGDAVHYPYDESWDQPVDASTFHAIAGKLAVAGARMFEGVFERSRDAGLDDIARKLREAARSGEHALTVNAADFHLPWRMLYTHPNPNEILAEDGSNVDPRGFWGYQHIIEQFTNEYMIKDHVIASDGKLGLAAALHERIDQQFQIACLARHRDFVQRSGDRLSYVEWTRKADMMRGLSAIPFQHQVVYFLCHSDGAGTTARPSLQPPALKLVDGALDAVELAEVINHGFAGRAPFIFINACRAGHLGTLVSHNFTFATEFLEHGVICLIGPQVEVPAVFAGEFGKRLLETLVSQTSPPPRVGIILRDLTRYMWERNNPFGLVYSLYAGADCHVRWEDAQS
jgi:hypothetical protein